jgi:hypothetical protein
MSTPHQIAAYLHEAAAQAWDSQMLAIEVQGWEMGDAWSAIAAEATRIANAASRRAQKWEYSVAVANALRNTAADRPSDEAPADHRAAAKAHLGD